MCDYSLYTLPNRLAVKGEELVVYRFSTDSLGFASLADIQANAETQNNWKASFRRLLWGSTACSIPAVCIPPGARLTFFEMPAKFRGTLRLEDVEEVKFIHLSVEAHQYRDAVEFSTGRQVRLCNLPDGIRVRVESLSGEEISLRERFIEELDEAAHLFR